jgi:hypothetical protein
VPFPSDLVKAHSVVLELILYMKFYQGLITIENVVSRIKMFVVKDFSLSTLLKVFIIYA